MIVLLIRYKTYYQPVDDPETGVTISEEHLREWTVLDQGFWDSEDELIVEKYNCNDFDFDGARDAAKEFVKKHYPDMQVLHVGRLPDSLHSIATLIRKDSDTVSVSEDVITLKAENAKLWDKYQVLLMEKDLNSYRTLDMALKNLSEIKENDDAK